MGILRLLIKQAKYSMTGYAYKDFYAFQRSNEAQNGSCSCLAPTIALRRKINFIPQINPQKLGSLPTCHNILVINTDVMPLCACEVNEDTLHKVDLFRISKTWSYLDEFANRINTH